jgi:hypothetical protein
LTTHLQRLPIAAALPLAHLTMRIYRAPGGGLSWGMAPTDAPAGAAVEICGFADQRTAAQLRAIADAIEVSA